MLGSSAPRTVNIRVVSATNRNLSELVEREEFREDLLYRLNLIAVHIPPLRERPGDIPLIASHFLRGVGQVYRRHRLSLTDAALAWLQGLRWPGNVRQLKHLIERAVLMTEKDVLDVGDFSLPFEMETRENSGEMLPAAGAMKLDEIEKTMIMKCIGRYGGNMSKVAEALGLSRPALYRRLEKHGIAP